jgi:hypothetical protein
MKRQETYIEKSVRSKVLKEVVIATFVYHHSIPYAILTVYYNSLARRRN